MQLEVVEAAGTWYDIGLAEGRAQRSLMRYVVRQWAGHHAGTASFRALDRLAARAEAFLGARFPEEWDELLGIAEGAGLEIPLLVAANFPQALNALASADPGPTPAGQCSNILFPTSEWGPLLGGTLDDPPVHYLLRARPEGAIPFCCVMFPAFVACTWGGLNAAGLALCGASARPLCPQNQRPDSRAIGLDMIHPQRVLLRSCRTVDQALDRLAQPDMNGANNYSLMDASGKGVQAQGYAGAGYGLRVAHLPAERGLCCGNFHPWEIGPEDAAGFPDKAPVFGRYRGVRRGVEENVGRYSVDALRRVLTGHEGDVDACHSVCNANTSLAMIAAPTAGRLLFAAKPPCREGFVEYPFGKE